MMDVESPPHATGSVKLPIPVTSDSPEDMMDDIVKDDVESSNDADQSESMVDTAPVSPKIRGVRRSRKTVDRTLPSPPQANAGIKKYKPAPLSGSGIKLGDISKIADKLAKVAVKDDALKRLHRVLYGSEGTATTRKKEIRLWNGTVSEETKSAMAAGLAGAKSVQILKDIANILSVATGGDRATLESRICEFLLKPIGSTDPLRKKTKKVKSSSKKKSSSSTSSSAGGFSVFLKKRMEEVLEQAGGSMSARDVTELLTMEWKNMTTDEKEEYSSKSAKKSETNKVQKIIKKDNTDDENGSSSDSSSSSDDSEDDSSSSSGSSSSDSEPEN